MLKPEIHDPQGEAIASACHRLGFGQVVSVRQGKRFEIELDGDGPADEATAREVAKLAAELLANPVIEEFSVRPRFTPCLLTLRSYAECGLSRAGGRSGRVVILVTMSLRYCDQCVYLPERRCSSRDRPTS